VITFVIEVRRIISLPQSLLCRSSLSHSQYGLSFAKYFATAARDNAPNLRATFLDHPMQIIPRVIVFLFM
jgi:hypothetical protein